MEEKCFICEYDQGPLLGKHENCFTCVNNSNFQVKKRVTPGMLMQYEKIKRDEEWIEKHDVEFDRDTALLILNEISKHMRPSTDKFGNKTLVISRYNFEIIRKKFLDKK